MPIYEYGCEACKIRIERIESLSDSLLLPSCSECGKEMTRLVSRPGQFVFKGGGFYDTEYDPTGLHWANKWAGPNPSKEPMPSGFDKKRWCENGPEVRYRKDMHKEIVQDRRAAEKDAAKNTITQAT